MTLLWELLSVYQTQVVAILVTCLVTGGATFLFHPAILVYYHEDIDHTTKTLRHTKHDNKNNDNDYQTTNNNDVLLSLVIPAYNEQDRLTVMLDECYEYFCRNECPALENLVQAYQKTKNTTSAATTINTTDKQQSTWSRPRIMVEWIVVNDGSSDETCQVFENYVSKLQDHNNNQARPFTFRLVSLPYNEGKGAAVQVGMTEANGYYRLMVDADGATTFDKGLEAVTEMLLTARHPSSDQSPVVVFGSRAGDGAKRSAVRSFLMHSFLWLRSCVVGTPVSLRDTQCGFKLFDQPSAIQLFNNLHLRRWAFDIELVYVALSLGLTIQEVTVPWHEVDGSKLNTGFLALIWVSIGMLRDMMCVRACYVLGIWKIHPQQPAQKR